MTRSVAPQNSAILFGASGNIGSALLNHMNCEGWSVSGTYATRVKPGLIRCDLTEPDPLREIDLPSYRYGIILSAAASIDRCKRDPAVAARLNVEGTRRLLALLAENDVRPVFFSTDYVYDGGKGNYPETEPPSPNTEYGRQKAAMETHIQETYPQALIVRISKIFSASPTDSGLLGDWYRAIQKRETIRNISDQRISATYDGDITAGLLKLLDREATGLFNLCQPNSYTRGELLAEFLHALGIQYENVVEMESRRFGFLDERPGDISLNPSKFMQFTGFQFTPMEEVFRRFRRNLEDPRGL
jgi:dTDP-4-dehydrorhamnose reductase